MRIELGFVLFFPPNKEVGQVTFKTFYLIDYHWHIPVMI